MRSIWPENKNVQKSSDTYLCYWSTSKTYFVLFKHE